MPTMFPAENVPEVIRTGASTRINAAVDAGFKPGDRVLIANVNPVTHTRLPRYVRGKVGMVERDHGVFVFPDTNAELLGEKPQHVYSVRFEFKDLWGSSGTGSDKLYIDMFEDYLLHTD